MKAVDLIVLPVYPSERILAKKGFLIYFPKAKNQRQQVHITVKVLTLKSKDNYIARLLV